MVIDFLFFDLNLLSISRKLDISAMTEYLARSTPR